MFSSVISLNRKYCEYKLELLDGESLIKVGNVDLNVLLQSWWADCPGARYSDDDRCESPPVQDPWLVSEQKEGLQGWQILSGCVQRLGYEA